MQVWESIIDWVYSRVDGLANANANYFGNQQTIQSFLLGLFD